MSSLILSILSGILLSTSYIPFYPWALFFCLVPLFAAWTKSTSLWKSFWLGWLTQWTFNMVGFHWIFHTAREFGHLPDVLAFLGLAAFSSFGSLDLPLSAVVVQLIKRRIPLDEFAEVALYGVTFYLIQTLNPTIFPWNLGYPWYWANWPAIQWADVIGFEGLSCLTLLSQALFWKMWQLRTQTRLVARWAVGFILVFAILNFSGNFRKKQLESSQDQKLQVLLIQANIGNLEKAYAEKGVGYQDYIVQRHMDLTREALRLSGPVDLIVYPETALPISLNDSDSQSPLAKKFLEFVKEIQLLVITGAYKETTPKSDPFNAIFVIAPNGSIIGQYEKVHRLAFGEYIPFGDTFPILYDWMPFVSRFNKGDGPKVIGWKSYKMGFQVCYEGLYPSFSRQLSLNGANFFINVTNDSWFGQSFEPQQHLIMTAARAIEFRTPLIRSTNTGITTIVSKTGTLGGESPLHQSWYGVMPMSVTSNHQPTFYAQYQPLVFVLSFVIFCALIWCARKRSTQLKKIDER